VPLARYPHPEFGYVGSPRSLLPRLGIVFSIAVLGPVAGAGGAKMLTLQPPAAANSARAVTVAPGEASIAAPGSAAKKTGDSSKSASVATGQAPSKRAPVGSPCREEPGAQVPENDCVPVRVVRPQRAPSANERPAIAAVAIGHRNDPAMLPAEPASPVAAAPPEHAGTTAAVDTVPAAKPAPVPPPTAASPAPQGNIVASGSGARPAEGNAAKMPAAGAHQRRAPAATAKAVKPGGGRGSENALAHRQPRQRPAGSDVDGALRRIRAFARSQGVDIPSRWLGIARKILE
jgi:hypothetical protein